jgi:hypothetical protein
MPAKSIAQARAARMALALQSGDSRKFAIEKTPGVTAWGAEPASGASRPESPVEQMAGSMTPQQLTDFTKLKPGAPRKVK